MDVLLMAVLRYLGQGQQTGDQLINVIKDYQHLLLA